MSHGQLMPVANLCRVAVYHLSSGFINHNIAQNDMFYSVNNIRS